jgi:hypothetical protein
MTSQLTLGWRLRPGAGNVTERRHLDFLVDGQSLFVTLQAGDYDLIGRLGWEGHAEDTAAIEQLLLQTPSPISDGRHMLFVCPECGDLGCGALTVQIAATSDGIIWRDFAHENNYDPDMTERERFRPVGPFIFAAEQYAEALRRRGA